MATTSIATGDSRTVVQYQQERIAEEASNYDVFAIKGFVGEGAGFAIGIENDLSKQKGDTMHYYLEARLTGQGRTGDNTLRGSEEQLLHYEDSVSIDQIRHGVILAGKMTEQRTRIKLRKRAPKALGRWGGEWKSELAMTMLSGARGVNAGKLSLSFSGFGGNSLVVPDSDHLLYGGNATAKANVDSSDIYDLSLVERFVTLAETSDPQLTPLSADGEDKYLGLIHPYQARDLRTNTNSGQWADIQKSVTQSGKANLFMKNALGEHAGVVFHKSQDIRRFTDYGAGSNVAAARALFLGAQAGVMAFGEGFGESQWDYVEIKDDYNNQAGFAVGMIMGLKPCIFNSKRFGMVAADTAAAA